jgi:antitoxin CptB
MIIATADPIFNSAEKIKYSARRGMLELDIMLKPYLSNCYMLCNIEEKKLFIDFLTSEDNDMFDWLFKGVTAPDKFVDLIQNIMQEKKRFNTENFK